MNDGSQGGWTRRQEQGEEVDFEALKLVKTNHDVNVSVSDKVDLGTLPGECNLMAISNTWGILAVGGNSDVRIHRLDDIHRLLEDSPKDASPRSEPKAVISLTGRPVWIKLAANEQTLVVTTSRPNGIQLFRLQDVMSGKSDPYHALTSGLPGPILDVLPNPAPPSENGAIARVVALVSTDGLFTLDLDSGGIQQVVLEQLTSASWSPKGKQIVCGHRTGKLVQYTPEGNAKAEVPPPPELSEEFHPTSIEWIENDLFLVSYKNGSADEDEPLSVFTIQRRKASSEIVYHEFFDPLNTMGVSTRPGSHRWIANLKQWGETTRHLSFLLSGRSSEVAVMRQTLAQDQQAPIWESLMLEETARGVMPVGKSGVSDDASCIGLGLDLTSTKPIVMGIVGGVEMPNLPPAPRLLAYTQEGFIVSFDLRYQEAGEYPHMVKPQDIGSAPSRTPDSAMESTSAEPASAQTDVQAETKPAFGGFGSNAFGAASTSSTSTTGFGQSAFGQPNSFKNAGQSAFGQPAASSTETKSAFGQPSTSGFGFSGFGKPSGSNGAAGSTEQAAFGQSSPSPSAFGKSAFGSTSTPSAFGQSAFGQKPTSTPGAFGQSAFGSSQTSSAFGTPAASSTSTSTSPASAFGQSAFGQKPGTSADKLADKPAFGQSSTPSAFGQSAFGQSSKPSAFGQTSSASPSAFSTTSSTSTGGFAGFGQKPSGQTGFGFGSSAFGQSKPSTSSGAGSSPFGSGGAVGAGSAFGSSSAFGQSGFGSKTAVSPFASTTSKEGASSPTQVSVPSSSGFGLGGLDSALDSASTNATSPPDSPVGPAKTKQIVATPSAQSQTPPDSPVFGASKHLSGRAEDDDDSPPPTPKPVSQAPAKPSQSTSSFIKPATAFGSSSGFGSFGQTPAKPTSTTPTATPNAFSKPIGPSTPSSGAFGSSGFGSTAFGQSSTPSAVSAFGKPAAAPPAVGNITGGFGGFAAKKSDSPSAFGGFGGTAGKSAFGATNTGGSFSALLSGDQAKTPSETPTDKVLQVKQEPISPSPPTPNKVEDATASADKERQNASAASPPPVKQEAQSPEPQGYDVPTTKPEDKAAPAGPAADASQAATRKDAGLDSIIAPKDTSTERQGGESPSAESQTGSSPEMIHHEEAQGDGDDDGDQDQSADVVHEEDEEEAEENEEEEVDEDEEDEEEDEDEEEYGDDDEQEEGEEGYSDEDDYDEDEHGDEDEETVHDQANVPENITSPLATDPSPQPPTTDTPSLFSRLGPPTSRPSYQGKHAVRTSSPLGSQPPENAETATPPGTPHQSKPAALSRDASTTAPPPFFGFGASTTSSSTSKPASTAASPSVFGKPQTPSPPALGLGKPPVQQADQKPAFSFGLGKPSTAPVPAASTEKGEEKKPFFGFGTTGQTPAPAPPRTTNKLPFAFGTPAAPSSTSSTTTPKPTALFGQPQPQQPPVADATPIKPVHPATPGPSLAVDSSKFATPSRTPVKDSPQAKDDGSRQMAAVMTRMVTDLMSEIKTLREALAAHAEYHRGVEPKFNKVSVNDLDAHSDLPFSSLSDITQVIDQLAAEMTGVTQKDQAMELRVLELQSKMVKTDMKIKQAERLLEAHDDPTFAHYGDGQELSQTQREERISMRRRKQAAESRLDDLERSVERLKRAAAESQPTVEKLHQSIDEVEAAIVDKQDLIEDLSMRVKSIRLSTPGSRRSIGYSASSRPASDIRNKVFSFEIPHDVVVDVQRQLDQQDRKMTFTSKVAPVTRTPVTDSTVQVAKLPLPGKVDISAYLRDDKASSSKTMTGADEGVKAVPADQRPSAAAAAGSTRTPNAIPSDDGKPGILPVSSSGAAPAFPPAFSLTPGQSPSPAFGGIKLSLDPGDLSSSHTRNRTAIAGSTRAHHAAPRLSASPSSEKSGTTPAISFFPPSSGGNQASASPSTKNSPKGFFSFSGFGQ